MKAKQGDIIIDKDWMAYIVHNVDCEAIYTMNEDWTKKEVNLYTYWCMTFKGNLYATINYSNVIGFVPIERFYFIKN